MLLAAEPPVEIHPAVGMPLGWLLLGLLLLLIAVGVPATRFVLRRLADRRAANADSPLEELRNNHLARVDALVDRWRREELDDRSVIHSVAAEARGFVGVASGHDVDFMTLGQARSLVVVEPRLRPLVELWSTVSETSFAPAAATKFDPDFTGDLLFRLRQVIEQWY